MSSFVGDALYNISSWFPEICILKEESIERVRNVPVEKY